MFNTNCLNLILLISCCQTIEAKESCEKTKVVDGKNYILLDKDSTKSSEHGCFDNCAYRLEEEDLVPTSETCFNNGVREATCKEEQVSLPSGCVGEDVLSTYQTWSLDKQTLSIALALKPMNR